MALVVKRQGPGMKGVAFSVPPGTGAELLFEVFSQRYERGSTIVTSNLPFDEWTGVFGSERLTGARLDRLTHVHILEMNGDSYRLKQSKQRQR
jgi:DNA replication protein DnaC